MVAGDVRKQKGAPKRAASSAGTVGPNLPRAEAAVREFLLAMGVDLSDADLLETPARVARAWAEHLLDGYRARRGEAGAEILANEADGVVVASGIRFFSMCPHHLLPVEGTATLAYAPQKRLIGFGKLGPLVDRHAHRLVLEERLGKAIADDVMETLAAKGVVVKLVARHFCVRLTDPARADAAFTTIAARGPDDVVKALLAAI